MYILFERTRLKKKRSLKQILQKGMNKIKRSFFKKKEKNRGDSKKKVSQKKKNTNRRNIRESH